VEPLDLDFANRAIACNDQKTEPVDVSLEIPIRFLAYSHDSL
jgi:hypothetical protein